mgnify:CR=1 FL=1
MKLSVALSGQYSYKEGEIQIVVPKYILSDRDGKPAGELEAAVPEAPSQQSTFAGISKFQTYKSVKPYSASTKKVCTIYFSVIYDIYYPIIQNFKCFTRIH